MAKKIERRNSPIHGSGVFAQEFIGKDEEIVEYTGDLISHATADEKYHGDLLTGHTFLFALNDEWIIDVNLHGNIARWINHSCEPNAIAFVHEHASGKPLKDKVFIEALRDIQEGEEITYDYGFEFDVPYTKKILAAWACRCGKAGCTGSMLKPKKKKKKKK